MGLFVQLNFNCESNSSCGASNPSFSKQSSFLSVLLSDVDSRSNMEGYNYGDTGLAVLGSQYFSYLRKSARNSTNDGELAKSYEYPQISFGLMPVSCASSSDYGCFWGEEEENTNLWASPSAAMITSSDPYRGRNDNELSGNMTLGVMHAMSDNNSQQASEKEYKFGSFDQAIVMQKQIDSTGAEVTNTSLDDGANSWRGSIQSSSNRWIGYLNGFFNIDDGYSQTIEGKLEINFDVANDRLKANSNNIQFYKLPFLGNSGEENTWFRSGKNAALLPNSFGTQISQSLTPKGEGHFSIQFGDDLSLIHI